MAQRRHPRPGYGYHPGSHHGGYYGRHHGGYYPYYGGYYRPYYPYAYGSVYIGWPYYSAWPYYAGGYYLGGYYSTSYDSNGYGDAPGYDPGYDQPAPRSYEGGSDTRERSPDARYSGRLRLEVRPEDTSVYIDGRFRGSAREARILDLPAGRHAIELVRPGYAIERREVDIVSGERTDVAVEMRRP